MVENGNQIDQNGQEGSKWQSYLILITIALILIITAVIFYPDAQEKMLAIPSETSAVVTADPDETSITNTPIIEPTEVVDEHPTPTSIVFSQTSQFGSLVLSLREGNDIHLFLYRPFLEEAQANDLSALPLTRITSGAQQDITPAISPDGTKIAFSSNRDGPWDLYILDLVSGETDRFTDTRAYDGNPTWSPDGKWLAYESYQLNNLDIFIQDIDQTSGPIPLTNHSTADFSPNWSGEGRKIGYVSNRNGQQEIWYADLDSSQADKGVKVPGVVGRYVDHPTWSSDGRFLSWSVLTDEGQHSLVTWDSTKPSQNPRFAGQGDWPLWAGKGELLYSVIKTPYESYLTAYPGQLENVLVMLPSIRLPGTLEGISWSREITLNSSLDSAQNATSPPLWEPISTTDEQDIPQEKLIELRNVDAPLPEFIKPAGSTYSSLRQKIRELAGWDFMSTLEQAYIPLEESFEPGINFNWLYTGRGMLINDIPRLADWLIVIREDYPENTYWRVFIKGNNQQGVQGKPIKRYPWDFSARYSGSNETYENGGARSNTLPSGYWIDFTELAAAYGWSRFPAETYWQFSETASRYQYFAFTQGLDLETALEQLYSPEAIQSVLGSINP